MVKIAFMNKKVLIIAPYSYPSACGVWTRALADAKALKAAGYTVLIFTTNVIKRTGKFSSDHEVIEGIEVKRFKPFFKFGENAMFWWFGKSFRDFNPDFVHAHLYRHPHSLLALILAKRKEKKVFLTTHAPFDKFEDRSVILKFIDTLYDFFLGWSLRLYTKVIRITDWETKYLKKLGLKESVLIENGIAMEFINNVKKRYPMESNEIKVNISNPNYQIRYMGRLDPSKRLEWVIECAKALPEYNFKIVGAPSGYGDELKSKSPNLTIVKERYNKEDFFRETAIADIFLMPSAREGLPFVAIEALSQGMILITSDIMPFRELIVDGVNGFIVNSSQEMAEKITWVYKNWEKLVSVRQKAIQTGIKNSEDESNKKLIVFYKSFDERPTKRL